MLYTLNLVCAELYYADDAFRQFKMMRGDEELAAGEILPRPVFIQSPKPSCFGIKTECEYW